MATRVDVGDRRRRSRVRTRAAGGQTRRTSSEAKRFLALADAHLGQIEEAAGAADPSIEAELGGLVTEVTAGCVRLRERLAQADEPVPDPPEGVVLLTRQLARAGAVRPEIESVLGDLGVADPRSAVRRTLL